MTKFKKKGFTIVELVIVIAVIAILAAVLIPTFSNIIRRAKISADVQLCRNLNTVLANADAEGRIPGSVYDVLYLENEAGYILENLNPTSEGFYYAWDEKNNKIIYIQEDLTTVYYPEDYNLNPNNCWITVGSAAEASFVAGYGYNLALERDIDETITLSNVVSINTLGFRAGDVTFIGEASENSVEVAYMIGSFGTVSGNIGSSSVVQSGSASTVSLSGNSSSSVTVSGYVNSFSATGVSASVSSTGLVNTVASTSTSQITNNGVVQTNSGSSQVTGGSTSTANNVVTVSSKESIDSIRTQVASGSRNFAGETVKLDKDISLNGIAFTPIANISRDGVEKTSAFAGTFDGAGYSIVGFSTSGFTITGLNAGANDTTPSFTENKIKYNEAVYGLFGVTYDAVIKNLTVNCNVDLVLDHSRRYVGDSVGGIVGCAFGTITFENCTVYGTVKGYDGVGGFVGRLAKAATAATFINCTNNAEVIGVRKTGGFIGSSYAEKVNKTITYTNCVNNGTIRCLGVEKDAELECWTKDGTKLDSTLLTPQYIDSTNYNNYYTASASNGEYASSSSIGENTYGTIKITVNVNGENGFINNGKIYVGDVELLNNGTWCTANPKTYHGKP